jgi:hypothetical protein
MAGRNGKERIMRCVAVLCPERRGRSEHAQLLAEDNPGKRRAYRSVRAATELPGALVVGADRDQLLDQREGGVRVRALSTSSELAVAVDDPG